MTDPIQRHRISYLLGTPAAPPPTSPPTPPVGGWLAVNETGTEDYLAINETGTADYLQVVE